jgi:hypothetical protein
MYKKMFPLENFLYFSPTSFSKGFPFSLDDPTPETIKKGQKIRMCLKCEAETPYIFLDPTCRTTWKANEELGEILI